MRVFVAVATAAACAAGLSGCGSAGNDSVVVRIGGQGITEDTVSRWMAAMAPEGIVPDPPGYQKCIAHEQVVVPGAAADSAKQECREQYLALKQKALEFLISSEWLIGEARARGFSLSDREVQAQPDAHLTLLAGHTTTAERGFALRASLAAARLRQALNATVPPIPPAQVASYYSRHISRFERPERRYLDIVETFKSDRAARQAMRAGNLKGFAKVVFHESLERTSLAHAPAGKRALRRAILAAKAHVLSGPVRLYKSYCIFEITRIMPATRVPLSRARPEIERPLVGQQRLRALARFIRAWRLRWIARTDCRPGYIVQKCRRYKGSRVSEAPYAFSLLSLARSLRQTR
jgi:foldase protein PrsA